MFLIVLNSILILVICMVIGFLCRKKNIITEQGQPVLSSILVNVTLPCLMVVSMQKEFDETLFNNSIMVLMIAFGIHFLGYLIGLLLCKILKAEPAERSIWIFSLVFSNLVYMGLPVIGSIYDSEAIFYVSMCNVAFNILGFTFGIKLITSGQEKDHKLDLKAIFLNLPIISTVIGFLFFIFSIRVPGPLYSAFSMLGNMTVPLSMIVIGAILAKNDLHTVFLGWKMYVVMAVRLLIMPVIVYVLLGFFIKDQMILGVLVLLTGMPVASLTAILAAQYDGNRALASKFVFISTILSVFTIPLLSLFLGL